MLLPDNFCTTLGYDKESKRAEIGFGLGRHCWGKCIALLLLVLSTPSIADFGVDFEAAALERTKHHVRYDGSYMAIDYPGGDVPADIGVCTDVVIRSYRAIGTDLQVLVHEDMAAAYGIYPSKRIWGLSRPDRNIDHRRVPNLQTFFERHGERLAISSEAGSYRPGNIVTWTLPGNLPHIGIVTAQMSETTGNPMIVHNIGAGPKLEDMLFRYTITGHYRYVPANYNE